MTNTTTAGKTALHRTTAGLQPKAGRTIIMTDGDRLHAEMLCGDILGRHLRGWEHDTQNDVAYLYYDRDPRLDPPQIHLVDTDAYDGSWQRRLAALEALPARVEQRKASLLHRLADTLFGHLAMQKGGAR